MMKRAAMYVRVSTRRQQEEATIESQKSSLMTFAKQAGYEIPKEWLFEDNGISGATLARPALDKLRDYASEGLFECIFVLSPDRLSRKYAYQALLLEEFQKSGTTVLFKSSPEAETPENKLLIQMQGMFSEYERAQIAERSRRGKIHKARNGDVSVLTQAPYGYRFVSATVAEKARFEIIDHEANIVRTIFDLYVKERLSYRKIGLYLKEKGVPSPKGNPTWCTSSIAWVLGSSTYRGLAYYGVKESCEPDPMRLPSRKVRLHERLTPKRGVRKRDPDKWIGIPVPRIVSDEVFEAAQELRSRNKSLSTRNTKEGSLLQGLIACQECGYAFKSVRSGSKSQGYRYYTCSKRKGNCGNKSIRIESLDQAIWQQLTELLESPELVKNEVSRRLSELDSAPAQQKQKQLQKHLSKLKGESDRLLDAYQEGCIELPELRSRMSTIKCEANNTRRRLTELDSGLTQRQLLELESAVEYFSHHLKSARNGLSLQEKRKVVRMLVKDILIGKDGITVNHIIPMVTNCSESPIARLCSDRREQ